MSISKQEWADLAHIDRYYSNFNWKGWHICGINPFDGRHQTCISRFCVDTNELSKVHDRHDKKKRQ